MSYLDYQRHDDTTPRTRLKDAIADVRVSVSREMYAARHWQVVRDTPAVYKGERPASRFVAISVRRARQANHELLRLMREWRELEVAS